MQPTSSNTQKIKNIKLANLQDSQAMALNPPSLFSFSEDFGHLITSMPGAVFKPTSLDELCSLISNAYQQHINLTIRGGGLSQSGQSLASNESIIIDMSAFDQILSIDETSIWVETSCSFSAIISQTLLQNKIPYVIPYNSHLTLGGVISAGGVGSSSFRYGSVVDNIIGLEVVTAEGVKCTLDSNAPLFHACLGGQGQFAVITKAQLKLKTCKKNVRTFFLLYLDQQQWLHDLEQSQQSASYIESFCTPALQGAKLTEKGRQPFAEWLYSLQVTIEYDEEPPGLPYNLKPWKQVHCQEESMLDFQHRHDIRFKAMKLVKQWDLPHPWYECFVDQRYIKNNLSTILNTLPLFYATVLQVAPIAKVSTTNFFMLPEAEKIMTIMVLPQGIPNELVSMCIETIKHLDLMLLPIGSKRYLSGFLGATIADSYWKSHFGEKYTQWEHYKKTYDTRSIFCSHLHPMAEN